MHSSRMHTGHSLTVCRSLLLGGVLLLGRGLLLGGLLPGGLLLGGVSFWGVLLLGVSFWGVSLGGLFLGGSPSGGSPSGGCLLLGGASFRETPPVDRITDTSKNITLATSLRPVITHRNVSLPYVSGCLEYECDTPDISDVSIFAFLAMC